MYTFFYINFFPTLEGFPPKKYPQVGCLSCMFYAETHSTILHFSNYLKSSKNDKIIRELK